MVEWRANEPLEDHFSSRLWGTDYLRNLSASWYTWTIVEWKNQVPAVLGLPIRLINLLVIGDQALLSMKPPYLLHGAESFLRS